MTDNCGFECEICGKNQKSKSHLRDHKKEQHIQPKLKCNYCDSTIVQSGSLKRHEVQIHKIVNGDKGNYANIYKTEASYVIYSLWCMQQICYRKTCTKGAYAHP